MNEEKVWRWGENSLYILGFDFEKWGMNAYLYVCACAGKKIDNIFLVKITSFWKDWANACIDSKHDVLTQKSYESIHKALCTNTREAETNSLKNFQFESTPTMNESTHLQLVSTHSQLISTHTRQGWA